MVQKVVPEGKEYVPQDDEKPLWSEPFGIGVEEELETKRNHSSGKTKLDIGISADVQSVPKGRNRHMCLEKRFCLRFY